MRTLRLAAAAIMAVGTGLPFGTASADGVARSADPYIYTAPAAVTLTYDWTGFYIGAHVGAAHASKTFGFDRVVDPDCFIFGPCDPTSTFRRNGLDVSSNSFVGGGFVGLQKQWGWIVLGAEAGYLWMDHSASTGVRLESTTLGTPGIDITASGNVQNLLLVTAKFGWAHENILAYFKGGWASADVESRVSSTSTGTLLATSSSRENGWTAGAGLEYALKEHLIIGVEYNYVEINPATRTQNPVATVPFGGHIQSGIDIQSVTARLSFKFGGHN
jgi:outer membrane immunogenic protein